jgi:hypothetical protein
MVSPQDSAIRVFCGAAERYEIHAEEWAEIILLAGDWGWKPEKLKTFYLATNVEVSQADAFSLAETGQKILDSALADPLSVYPIRVNMAKLYEVTEFCRLGGFQILAEGSQAT